MGSGKSSAPKRTSASNSPELALAKPRPRNKRAEDAKAARLRRKVRRKTVEAWGLACACRRCGDEWQRLQIHEEPPRSQGGDPNDPFDCLPLSASCHRKRTGDVGIGQPLRISIASPIWRCRGPMIFEEGSEKWVTAPWSKQRFSLGAIPSLITEAGMRQ